MDPLINAGDKIETQVNVGDERQINAVDRIERQRTTNRNEKQECELHNPAKQKSITGK